MRVRPWWLPWSWPGAQRSMPSTWGWVVYGAVAWMDEGWQWGKGDGWALRQSTGCLLHGCGAAAARLHPRWAVAAVAFSSSGAHLGAPFS